MARVGRSDRENLKENPNHLATQENFPLHFSLYVAEMKTLQVAKTNLPVVMYPAVSLPKN